MLMLLLLCLFPILMQPAMFYWKERLAIQGTCAPMEHCSISQGKVPVNVCSKERVLHFSKIFFLLLFLLFFFSERTFGNPRNVCSISQGKVPVNGGEHFLNI